MKQDKLKDIARDTQECIENGYYIYPSTQQKLSFPKDEIKMVTVYHPEDFVTLLLYMQQEIRKIKVEKTIWKIPYFIEEKDTFYMAKEYSACAVLNFASAKHPGGRFLEGKQGQEESLARSSTLYASIGSPKAQEMYEYNRKKEVRCYYSEYMLYSPNVYILKNKDGIYLKDTKKVSVITATAVNLTGISPITEKEKKKIENIMLNRIRMILSIAYINGNHNIVLGAWGCGVFKHKPSQIAQWFYQVLQLEQYGYLFDHVIFAILKDKNEETIKAFRHQFK